CVWMRGDLRFGPVAPAGTDAGGFLRSSFLRRRDGLAMRLYEQLAADVERLIADGTLRAGDRLPSVRELRQRRRVSQATVLQAYSVLERRALIECRPRSGYFVARIRPPRVQAPLPGLAQP